MSAGFAEGAVVVGVDGTGKATRALEWAGHEAARRGVPVHVVYAFPWLSTARAYEMMTASEVTAAGERITGAALERLRATHPDVPGSGEVLFEHPAVALVGASSRASVVVLGARGLGRIAGRLLGSVSQKVAAHAHGTVAVVREDATLEGPVVVGVDPGENQPEVLQAAFEQAAGRGVPLHVVHADRRETELPELADDRVGEVFARAAAEAADAVRVQTANVAARYPGVTVHVETVPGHPVDVLTARARGAGLLVVGSRGRGGLAGLRLGSVTRGVLHDAPAVLVVRPRP